MKTKPNIPNQYYPIAVELCGLRKEVRQYSMQTEAAKEKVVQLENQILRNNKLHKQKKEVSRKIALFSLFLATTTLILSNITVVKTDTGYSIQVKPLIAHVDTPHR